MIRDLIWKYIDRGIIGEDTGRRYRFIRALPKAAIRFGRNQAFIQLVRYLGERSPFYKEKFRKHNIHPAKVRTPEDLGDFYTTSQDLKERSPKEFLCQPPQLVFETTGTKSPKPKQVYFSYAEIENYAKEGACGLYHLGIRREDRVISMMDTSFWNAAWTSRESLRKLGCLYIEASKIPPEEFYERASNHDFNVLFAEPSWLSLLTQVAVKKGIWPLKLILVGGENITEQTRNTLESIWKTDIYMGYGQTESFGSAGLECARKQGYHISENNLWYEIYKPDAEGYGELVLSTLQRRVMPLLRYRTSDVTRLIDEPCTCGIPNIRRIAKIRGRCDEMINCGAGNITPWLFERVFHGVSDISSDWQVAVMRDGNLDLVEFRLELTDGNSPVNVEAKIKSKIQTEFPDLWRNYAWGLFAIRFRFYPLNTLRTKRKLVSVVDERYQLLHSH